MEVFEGFERIRRSVAEKEYIKIDSSGTRVT
jgi:hypothetical protein